MRCLEPGTLWALDREGFRAAQKQKKGVDVTKLLGRVELLSSLSFHQLQLLRDRMAPATIGEGEYVMQEGEPGNHFYVLVSGTASVTRRKVHAVPASAAAAGAEAGEAAGGGDEEVHEEAIATLGPGMCFGEGALFNDRPRAASVRADEEISGGDGGAKGTKTRLQLPQDRRQNLWTRSMLHCAKFRWQYGVVRSMVTTSPCLPDRSVHKSGGAGAGTSGCGGAGGGRGQNLAFWLFASDIAATNATVWTRTATARPRISCCTTAPPCGGQVLAEQRILDLEKESQRSMLLSVHSSGRGRKISVHLSSYSGRSPLQALALLRRRRPPLR